MGGTTELSGPELTQGVALEEVPRGGMLLGKARGEAVMLVRPLDSDQVFAVGATCTHYGGPLAEGLLVGTQVRCPWHHACFDVRTGEAVAAPALSPVPCFAVERRGSLLVVKEKLPEPGPRAKPASVPESVLIAGAGAAGNAAAEMLRREGYDGPVTLIEAQPVRPVDRPNLSKDYLAGTAPEDWVYLRGEEFYAQQRLELVRGTRMVALDPAGRRVQLSDGTSRSYGALLLATGADPVKLPLPGADQPHVFTLRSLADSRSIVAAATSSGSSRAVVIGASFIGLEVAASLRARGLEVHVVGPDRRPLERVLGPELGAFVRGLHEEHGVVFHLGHRPAAFEEDAVVLDDGSRLPADLVVVGVGVRPALEPAEKAGLQVDRGVVVDAHLQTSAPGVYAAGDLARYPDPVSGERVRIEHWVVAERQGQTAARNMLGRREAFRAVPFFWSQHYDVPINYVGHAESWDRIDVAGNLTGKDALLAYRRGGKILAVATVYRDRASLQAEVCLARGDQGGLEALLV
ncbi:MAG TPA: FAD-dependent oxidoreductase [Candidatus Polarisedimenticolaceae bacterium]|nr:FAD-dependent oxidoreductase [Candidatus Polarisedimenticolaceae bacterium]